MVLITVRDATAADVPAVAGVLARAFDDYPWTRWSVPADRYRQRLEELQAIYLGHAVDCGLVVVDENGQGVAAFVPPDAPELSPDRQQRVGELLGDRLEMLMATHLPSRPSASWDLATIGVEPDSWGMGIASAILTEGLRRMDSLGHAVSLETSDPRNVALYRRFGFGVISETQVPNGPAVSTMVRKRSAEAQRRSAFPEAPTH